MSQEIQTNLYVDLPHRQKRISLDGDCNIKHGEYVVIIKPPSKGDDPKDNVVIIDKALNVTHKSITAYNISGKSTELLLESKSGWIKEEGNRIQEPFSSIRKTTVYCEPEELELAGEPIDTPINGGSDNIELDGFYGGLETNRQVIVSGESDQEIQHTMPATLSSVEHKTDDGVPVDRKRTSIKLTEDLPCPLVRKTVKIHGNVVKADHGETSRPREILGNGDGSKASQAFELKQKPLSHTAAPTPSGIESTLMVYVNDVRWHEAEILADRQPTDRNFITKTDDTDTTTVRFGDGKNGARLPTGNANIIAEYRSGIGKAGNVRPGQLSNPMDKPLGVKEVINPLRASGGADKDGRDQARRNAPMMVKVLDRLISVQDYEDFARSYAGIGKARAVELSNGRRQVVHVTIAGADDIPIDTTSDLFLNLRQSLNKFGDPQQQIILEMRELLYITLNAKVRIMPDYRWEPVQAQLRTALLDALSFNCQELGEDVLLSQVFRVMQSVRGVDYVDIDFLAGIPEQLPDDDTKNNPGCTHRRLTREEIIQYASCLSSDKYLDDNKEDCEKMRVGKTDKESQPGQRLSVELGRFEQNKLRPAQLAFLAPNISELLVLNQIK